MTFERDIDVLLCQKLQKSASFILKCLEKFLAEHYDYRLTKKKIGHKNLLLEQIWRGRATTSMEKIWRQVLGQTNELTLENIVKLLASHYPEVVENFKEFQEISAALMERHRGLALSLAQKIASEIYHVDEEDLVGEALLGIVSAALRFKPSHKTNFSTYAYYVIRSVLIDSASRAQRGVSYPPSAYIRMKKEDSRPTILSFSDIEEEDENGEISQTGDEVTCALLLQPNGCVEDLLKDTEIRDIVEKFPPPFSDIARMILLGEIDGYKDLVKFGLPASLAAKLWDIVKKLVQIYVLP